MRGSRSVYECARSVGVGRSVKFVGEGNGQSSGLKVGKS